MKITKKLYAEISSFLETYWKTYFDGDLKTWANFLPDDYRNIGTTNEELWNSKKEILDYTNSVFEQMVGQVDFRNKEIEIISYEPYLMVHELGDLYVKDEDDWTLYAPLRLSSVIEKSENSWQVLHQHGSYPDSRTEEGEAFAVDALKAENKKLLAAVASRTEELEGKNKELEIEAALERVRARTMAMQHSDEMPEVANNLFLQVQELGLPAWSAGYCIWQNEKKAANCSMSSEGIIQKSFILPSIGVGYNFYDPVINGESFYVAELGGKEIVAHYEFMITLPVVGEILDGIKEAGFPLPSFQIFHIVYFKHGYLMFITYEPVPDAHDLFKRFASVFEQTYTRFLDLQKAEAQAKEAEIELALERVRARSMAMQDSDELPDAANLLFKEVRALGIPAWSAGYNLLAEDNKTAECWMGTEKGIQPPFTLPYRKEKSFIEMYDFFESDDTFLIQELNEKQLISHYKYMKSVPSLQDTFKEFDKAGIPLPKHQINHLIKFEYGYLLFITYEPVPESHYIFERFAKVFEQAYTRFLDLQKVEAQVREAQIETALEKVRSRSLAMHKSDELNEVVSILFERLKELQIPATAVGIAINIDGSKDLNGFVCGENEDGLVLTNYRLPYFNNKISKDISNALRKQLDFFIGHYSKKEKDAFYEYLLEHTAEFRHLPEDIKRMIFESPLYTITMVAVKNAVFNINDFEGKVLSKDEVDIIKRFAKVFEQTYTRFLDLQKAEAQAKEAQVEMALEKVRSRTMAMQKGEEVKDVVVLLYKELITLGVTNFATCGYVEINEKTNRQETWVTSPGGDSLGLFYLPLTGDVHFDERYKAWKKQQTVFHQTVAGKERKKHLAYAITTFNSKEAEEMVLNQFPDPTVFYCFNFSHGYLHLVSGSYLKEEEEALLARFTRVFEQTYARFLDLEKAEAQTREAQINLGVERVRAKALAMHKSEEIMEVVGKLKDELMALDIPNVIAATIFLKEGEDKVRMWDLSSIEKLDGAYQLPLDITFKLKKTDPHLYVKRVWENEEDYFVEIQNEKGFKRLLEFFRKNGKKEGADEIEEFIENTQLKLLHHAAKKLHNGKLVIDLLDPPTFEIETILTKMGAAFDLAYKRFEDLQKAEHQAKEAQIEAALERVRSRSMAMHKSEELADLSLELVKQVQVLGEATWFCAFNIYDDDPRGSLEWGSNGQGTFPQYRTPKEGVFLRYYKAGQQGKTLLINEIGPELCPAHYDYLCSLRGVGEQLLKMKEDGIPFPESQIDHVAFFKYGYVLFITYGPVPELHDVFKRFAKVFEQSYTRFLDLQKAEAQAREAQVESALERIRSQAMAMKESTDLLDIVVTMRTEFLKLGHEAGYFWHMRWHDEIYEKAMTSGDGTKIGMVMNLPRHIHGDIEFIDQWEKGKDPTVVYPMDTETALEYVHQMISLGDFKQVDPNAPSDDDIRHIGGITFIMARTTHGEIGFSLNGPVPNPPPESLNTLVRFASVFDLAYKRFEDLLTAEQQNRENEIELSLERVRARTMAMHNSDELAETVAVLFQQLSELGEAPERLNIGIIQEDSNSIDFWSTEQGGKQISKRFSGSIDEPTTLLKLYKAWKAKQKSLIIELEGKELSSWIEHIQHVMGIPFKENLVQKRRVHSAAFFAQGTLLVSTPDLLPTDSVDLLIRFTKVFEQTYTRFLDLKKAEAQAREAQIEVALERVRSQAMAMQHSDDLIKCTTIVFEELEKLKLPVERSGIGIFDEETKGCQLWTTVVDKKGKMGIATGITSLTIHPLLIETFNAWKSQESYSYVLEGKELSDYYKVISKGDFNLPKDVIGSSTSLPKEYYIYAPFGAGGIYLFAESEPTESDRQIIRRFAEVFHLTYTRYEDLQKAEARTLEATRQASLDRIRGEISSMRSTEDLQRITPLVWKELLAMQVPFIRCGVFIMDDINSTIKAYLSAPDGHSLGVLNLPFDATEFTKGAVDHWHQQKMYKIHWNKQQFQENMNSMINKGQIIQDAANYQGPEKPPESLHLHFISFKQGLLYAGNSEPLSEEALESVKALAASFSIAYSRYEDFKQLETAMNELKSTQSQLIHAEKMASLGELTAGIAHEIQNPLNFVNNFSEVNKELMEELQEELQKGDLEEVKAIAQDIIDNDEKIVHHGKRAEGIVKGMLQHSRTSSGEKEPTDINELADEFLRLSYHGLRAKDKSFNADFQLELDPDMPKMMVSAQDIGRVLLNLINNAFHAVKEADKPKVVVKTKLLKDKIEISVTDNGSGIPDDIKEKIFQPFFTTKATGEGTGLGLSLSYDIITKGHGGEMTVVSELGVGSQFIINLNIS